MRKRLVKILLIMIILIFAIQLKVHAAVITSTDKQVQSNSGEVTISVTSKQILGAYRLEITDTAGLELINASGGEISPDKKVITYASSNGTTNLGTYTFKVPTVNSDTKYNIKFLISGIETTNLDIIPDESNTAVLTVKAPVPEPEKPKSSEARLKSFWITPKEYDFTGFSKNIDKEEWSAQVPNNVTSVEVFATPKDSNAKVTGTGKVTLNEGNNKIGVKVTAEDGKTTKTYYLSIKRQTAEEFAAEEAAKNGENRLKSLGIKPKEYDFTGFNSETTEYTAEVPNEIGEIEVVATAIDSKAQITGTGIIELKEGENELKIDVIAVNGNKKTYTLKVTRKEAEVKEILGLSNLTITGITLTPQFNKETYEYKVDLEEDLSSLTIKGISNIEGAAVEVIGNENLKQGENVITILVTNKEKSEVVTYQIIVNKNVAVVEETQQMSWLKPSTWGNEEYIKIAIIIVLIILIICAILLKIKISKESKVVKKVDLPGKEELNKAMAEHQELTEETNNTTDIHEECNAVMSCVNEENKEVTDTNYIEEIARNKFVSEEFEAKTKTKRRGKHF